MIRWMRCNTLFQMRIVFLSPFSLVLCVFSSFHSIYFFWIFPSLIVIFPSSSAPNLFNRMIFLSIFLTVLIFLNSISIYLSISQSLYLFLNLSTYLSLYLSISQSTYLSIYLSIYLCISQSIVSISQSIDLISSPSLALAKDYSKPNLLIIKKSNKMPDSNYSFSIISDTRSLTP